MRYAVIIISKAMICCNLLNLYADCSIETRLGGAVKLFLLTNMKEFYPH